MVNSFFKKFAPLFVIAIVLSLTIFISGCQKELQVITTPQDPEISNMGQLGNFFKAQPNLRVPDSYIVVFKEDVTDVDANVGRIAALLNSKAVFTYKHAIKGFSIKVPEAVINKIMNDPTIAYIEEDQFVQLSATQTDATWGIDRVDQRDLPLNKTYIYNYTGSGVDVYIIDTGIRYTHNEFEGRAVFGFDAFGQDGSDKNGHGTHVAGTVGGKVYGIAKSVRLYSVRVLDASGSGTISGVIAGVDWVTSHHTTKPAVANMSLGAGASTSLDDAVKRSIADGITYVVAAGNSSANACNYSPARVPEAITVGATTSTDGFASYSNFGSCVDILAPGTNITSAWRNSNTATKTISGTSMAAPHVAGTAALYLQAYPSALPASVANAIVSNATSGKITNVPSGTPNLLLYTLFF